MKPFNTEIDIITRRFSDTFGDLTDKQLNWKPDSGTWSIAQNIDHLMVINQSYFHIPEAIRAGSYHLPIIARFGFLVSFFGDFILKGVLPDRRKKMKTFPIWEPAVSDLPPGILQRFEAHQETLKSWMDQSADLVAKGAVVSSPANRFIVYKLEKAFEIIVTHEKRHFEQAKEVSELIKHQINK